MRATGRMYRWVMVPLCVLAPHSIAAGEDARTPFTWPDGAKAAVSLSFDDGRDSQIDEGLPLFKRHDAQVTFYVMPSAVERRLPAWQEAVDDGHEIGNHSVVHPCSGNFRWARDKALDTYTLAGMRSELVEANERIAALLGVKPETFAYPCGQTFVGRGEGTRSYVPIVADLFRAGRGWLGEAPNDPAYCDFAQLTGMEMDGQSFEALRPVLEQTKDQGLWLVLAGHEIGEGGPQTTLKKTLDELLAYISGAGNEIWLAPVGTVAEYVAQERGAPAGSE